MDIEKNKKLILKSLAKHAKRLRGKKSQFMLGAENDISPSILSTVERALKDPQLTTVFKLSEAYKLKPSQLMKLIEDDLPQDFSLVEQ